MHTAASHAAALSQGQTRSHHAPRLNAARNRRRLVVAASHSSPFKVQLLHPVKVADADTRPLLVFLPGDQAAQLQLEPTPAAAEAQSVMSPMSCCPWRRAGTDGTGQAITPQLPGLLAAGYDIRLVPWLDVTAGSSGAWVLTQRSTTRCQRLRSHTNPFFLCPPPLCAGRCTSPLMTAQAGSSCRRRCCTCWRRHWQHGRRGPTTCRCAQSRHALHTCKTGSWTTPHTRRHLTTER